MMLAFYVKKIDRLLDLSFFIFRVKWTTWSFLTLDSNNITHKLITIKFKLIIIAGRVRSSELEATAAILALYSLKS